MARGPNGQLKKAKKTATPHRSRRSLSENGGHTSLDWDTVEARINEDWQRQGMASIYLLQRQVDPPHRHRLALFFIDVAGGSLTMAQVRTNVPGAVMNHLDRIELNSWIYVPCSDALLRQLIFGSIVWATRHQREIPQETRRITEMVLGPLAEFSDPDLALFGHDGRPRPGSPGEGPAPFSSQTTGPRGATPRVRSPKPAPRSGDRAGVIIPFHEVLPHIDSGLTLMVRHDPELPDGEYGVFEGYCGGAACDCRIVYLFVVSSRDPGNVLAQITVGFEPEAFYRRWLGPGLAEGAKSLKGPDLAMMAPQSSSAPALLRVLAPGLDPRRLNLFKERYFLFKKALAPHRKG